MSTKNDEQYILEILNGNSSAYAFLVNKHKTNVFHIALRILNNREEAEEIAQDVFLKAYQKLSGFKMEAKFSTWLYRIAYNAAISHQRKSKMNFADVDEDYIDNITEDEIIESFSFEDDETRLSVVKESMNLLDEHEKLLLELYYDKELSTSDIANITELSQSNVKVKLHRTRQKLMALVQQKMKNSIKIV